MKHKNYNVKYMNVDTEAIIIISGKTEQKIKCINITSIPVVEIYNFLCRPVHCSLEVVYIDAFQSAG